MNQEDAQSSNASSESTAGDEAEIKVNRTPEEYAKRTRELAAEAKKYRTELAETKARLDAIEQEKLEQQGKFQELAKREKERADKIEADFKKTQASYAYKSVTAQIEAQAATLGCIDTKALLKLIDLDEIEVGEEFEVSRDSAKRVLEQAAKEKPYLFQKPTPKAKDLPPGSHKAESFKGKSLQEMTLKEKIAALNEMKNKA